MISATSVFVYFNKTIGNYGLLQSKIYKYIAWKIIKKEIKKDLSIDTPLIAYDKYMSYIVYQSYNVKYDDKNTEKIINNVIDEALKERETSRGGTN